MDTSKLLSKRSPKLSTTVILFVTVFTLGFYSHGNSGDKSSEHTWLKVDDFEQSDPVKNWVKLDLENNTDPFIPSPQVTIIQTESETDNKYLLKKPAPEGVIGNRKAITVKKLPKQVEVGETYTFYTRINVESFPNNHSFGLSNLSIPEITKQNYNAFEPMIRITDKKESNAYKNDGTLQVLKGYKTYDKIWAASSQEKNSLKKCSNKGNSNKTAEPLKTNVWYELWYVVNNDTVKNSGQSYDLYIKGGEFTSQHQVYKNATFRMRREQALGYFITISNTGSKKKPYGNGGLRYDDIYMSKGTVISTPIKIKLVIK
jgi:hypothetical protein